LPAAVYLLTNEPGKLPVKYRILIDGDIILHSRYYSMN
jgi:hypothetical protein